MSGKLLGRVSMKKKPSKKTTTPTTCGLQLIYQALPAETVHFSHALEDLSQDKDGVLLHFSEQADVRADYVVAADGCVSGFARSPSSK